MSAGGAAPLGKVRSTDRSHTPGDLLVHELANLLDGALRNLQLALTALERDEARDEDRDSEREGANEPDASSGGADSESGGRDATGVGGGDRKSGHARMTSLDRLRTAKDAAVQMADLVRQWRSDRHASSLIHRPTQPLQDAVAQAVDLMQPRAASQGVSLEVELPDDILNLPAGPSFPVIVNAFRNSLEASATDELSPETLAGLNLSPVAAGATAGTEAGGKAQVIRLSAARTDAGVELTVDDDGPGLAPAMTDATGQLIFGATTKADGLGLGLMLARDLALAAGGQLRVTNRPTGGVRVCLSYPVNPT